VYARWLTTTALAYAVLHHLGLLPDGLGSGPEGTRWADWLDLLVPWLVLAPAALTMWAAPASVRGWMLFGAGVVAYVSGHGIHLAANSVGNQDPGETAHLWDEVMSLLLAVTAATYGWIRRRELGVVLLVGFAPAVAILVVELTLSVR